MIQISINLLKWCPCVEASMYYLCVPSGFDVRAGSDMSMSQFFPGCAGSYYFGRKWDWRWRDWSQSLMVITSQPREKIIFQDRT